MAHSPEKSSRSPNSNRIPVIFLGFFEAGGHSFLFEPIVSEVFGRWNVKTSAFEMFPALFGS